GPLKAASNDPRDYSVNLWASGNFSVFNSNALTFAVVTLDAAAVAFSGGVPGMVVEAIDALEYVLGLNQWAVPTLYGEDFELYAEDSRTGFELFRETFQPSTGPLQVLEPALFGDTGRPFLTGGEPLLLQTLAASPGVREIKRGVRVEVSANRDGSGQLLDQQTLTVTFEQDSLVIDRRSDEASTPIPIQAKLTSLDDGTEVSKMIGPDIETGPVTLSRPVTLGESALLSVGAVLRLDQWVEMDWNEALHSDLEGFKIQLLGGDDPVDLPTTVEPVGTYESIRLRPRAGWQPGKSYRLVLEGTIKDAADNPVMPFPAPGCTEENPADCPRASFTLQFETRGAQVFPGFDFQVVRDMERLGSLLFVAAGPQGLWVLDLTDPKNPTNFLGGDRHFAFPFGDQVRGLALDPHGRLAVSGGGLSSPGQVKIFDPLRLTNDPSQVSDLSGAWRGSTLVTDRLGSDELFARLPPTTPNHIEILSRDRESSWTLGVDDVPAEITVSPSELPSVDAFDLTVSGSDGISGQPVTVRNLTRGTWDRVDANPDGSYSLTVAVRHGERLQVLRNTDSLAYVQLDSYGVAAVDLNHFYGEFDGGPDAEPIVQSQVLRFFTHAILENEPDDVLCDPNGLYLGQDPALLVSDFTLLGRGTNGPWFLPMLVRSYGLVMVSIDGNNPVELGKVDWVCGVGRVPNPTSGQVGHMTGMGAVEGYDALVIYDDDDIIPAPEGAREVVIGGQAKKVGREKRDYVFMGNSYGFIYVVDVTNRLDLRIVAKIELPEAAGQIRPAGPITFDRDNNRLIVSGGARGVYTVDMGGPFPLAAIDLTASGLILDEDGEPGDDRILEQIEVIDPATGLPLNVNRRVELWSDLGLAWIGGLQSPGTDGDLGLGGLVYREPRVRFLGTGDAGLFEVAQVAPFGVPTAPIPGVDEELEHPGLVRVEMHLPGELADAQGELRVDLVSIGVGGEEITGAGDPDVYTKLPPTSYRDADGLLLKRQSDVPWHEGYQIFLSEPIITLADLRASHWYVMTPTEKDAKDSAGEPLCRRCDLQDPAQGVYPSAGVHPDKAYRELLSGHRLALRLQDAAETDLKQLYGALLASQVEAEVESVAWDISPSIQQEPFQNPSFGRGEGPPGMLYHSGEYTRDVLDLQLPGVGFDFHFARTYRNQTVGGGPLGPGWDFGYRARLRPLPDENVDFFDGRGRRVTFYWNKSRKDFDPPPGVFMTLTRDAAGYRIMARDGSILFFDRYGRLLSVSDVHRISDSTGSEMRFQYDASSRLVSVKAHGRGFDFSYDDDGLLESITDDTGRDVLFAYDLNGRLETVSGPLTRLGFDDPSATRLVTTYAYEEPGDGVRRQQNRRDNLSSITDARGEEWLRLTWDEGDGGMGHRAADLFYGGDGLTFDFLGDGDPRMTVIDRRG
ncbi:MAG: DUF6531 domain-containing protein, partial [Acidobacteriota bacterium]